MKRIRKPKTRMKTDFDVYKVKKKDNDKTDLLRKNADKN